MAKESKKTEAAAARPLLTGIRFVLLGHKSPGDSIDRAMPEFSSHSYDVYHDGITFSTWYQEDMFGRLLYYFSCTWDSRIQTHQRIKGRIYSMTYRKRIPMAGAMVWSNDPYVSFEKVSLEARSLERSLVDLCSLHPDFPDIQDPDKQDPFLVLGGSSLILKELNLLNLLLRKDKPWN